MFNKEQLVYKLGECHYKVDEPEKALEYFNTASKILHPLLNFELEMYKGKCLDKMKKFKEAI
jgi:tetratricopeptide (TPR) repeat protein